MQILSLRFVACLLVGLLTVLSGIQVSLGADTNIAAAKLLKGKRYTIISVNHGRWSAKQTWQPQRVPQAGDRVLIGPGTRVIYDVKSDAVIRTIKVSGDLTFAHDRDTLLNVGVLRVQPISGLDGGADAGVEDVDKSAAHKPTTDKPVAEKPDAHGHRHGHNHDHAHRPSGDQALLAVGMPNAPIPAKFTARIRLHFLEGMNKDNEPAIIARPGGRMEFHGSPMSRTWVKLGANLTKGDTKVTLSESVTGWRVGDQVIVTASNRDGSGRSFRPGAKYARDSQTERRTIKKIEGEIEAQTRGTVFDQLNELGHFPVDVQEAAQDTLGRAGGFFSFQRTPSKSQITIITRELAMLLKAGLTLDQALAMLVQDRRETGAVARLISRLRFGLNEGKSFTEVLEAQGDRKSVV